MVSLVLWLQTTQRICLTGRTHVGVGVLTHGHKTATRSGSAAGWYAGPVVQNGTVYGPWDRDGYRGTARHGLARATVDGEPRARAGVRGTRVSSTWKQRDGYP